MTVVYSLPNCGKCDAAKQKLAIFNIEYEERPYKHFISYHDGWREDESLDAVTARCFYGEKAVPLINHEGVFYDYPGFMSYIKKMKKQNK